MVQLFYGWLAGLPEGRSCSQPLPKDAFQHGRDRARLLPDRQGDEASTATTTACRPRCARWRCSTTRSCSRRPGSIPTKPPATLDELVDAARKMTKRDAGGNLLPAGITHRTWVGQDHHWWREVLIRQFGGAPYQRRQHEGHLQPRGRHRRRCSCTPTSPPSTRSAQLGFMDEASGRVPRRARPACTSTARSASAPSTDQSGLDWGVAELPSHNGVQVELRVATGSTASPTKATGAQARRGGEVPEASSPRPRRWSSGSKTVGELPAGKSVARDGRQQEPLRSTARSSAASPTRTRPTS